MAFIFTSSFEVANWLSWPITKYSLKSGMCKEIGKVLGKELRGFTHCI